MAISVDKIIEDNIASLAPPIPTIATRGMCITTNPLIPIGLRFMTFNDADTVGEFFGTNSAEFDNAEQYFNGFVGKNIFGTRPTVLYFGRAVMEQVSAYLRGGVNPILQDIKDCGDGVIILYFDGEGYPISLTMTNYNTLADIATDIQEQLVTEFEFTNAKVSYDGKNNCFFISNGEVGIGHTIGYASDGDGSGAIAEAMLLAYDTGAILSQGADPETFSQTISAIRSQNRIFIGFWCIYQFSTEYYLDMCYYLARANNAMVNYRDLDTIAQLRALVTTVLEPNGYAKQISLSTGKLVYIFNTPISVNVTRNNKYLLSAAINGTFNSFAVTQPNSVVDPVNKQFSALAIDDWTNDEYEEILSLGGNIYGLVDGGYLQRSVYRGGQCGNTGAEIGSYGSQRKLLWLYIENYIRQGVQTTLFSKMTDGRTITDLANDVTGKSSIISWITSFLAKCVYAPTKGYPAGNGMINPTDVLAEGINGEYELEQLSIKFGVDIQTLNQAFSTQGFFIQGLAETFDSKLESTMYINFAYVVTGTITTIIITQIPVI